MAIVHKDYNTKSSNSFLCQTHGYFYTRTFMVGIFRKLMFQAVILFQALNVTIMGYPCLIVVLAFTFHLLCSSDNSSQIT